MIYLKIPSDDMDAWCEKVGISPCARVWVCSKCKREMPKTQPFVTKDCFGVKALPHECGPGYTAATFAPRTPEAIGFWNGVIASFTPPEKKKGAALRVVEDVPGGQ